MMASSLKGSKHFNKEFAKSNLSLNNEKWKFVCSKSKHSLKEQLSFNNLIGSPLVYRKIQYLG